MRAIISFLLDVIVVALALWVVVRFVPGVELMPGQDISLEWTFVAVAAIFVVVNAVLNPILKFIGLPLTCLTLGLFALVINAAILAVVAWISQEIGLGLYLEGFWPAVIGAIVLGVVRWLLSMITEPLTARG